MQNAIDAAGDRRYGQGEEEHRDCENFLEVIGRPARLRHQQQSCGSGQRRTDHEEDDGSLHRRHLSSGCCFTGSRAAGGGRYRPPRRCSPPFFPYAARWLRSTSISRRSALASSMRLTSLPLSWLSRMVLVMVMQDCTSIKKPMVR